MRRVGKTTLMKMVFDLVPGDNKVFLDMDNPLDQIAFEEKDFNNILANLKQYGLKKTDDAFVFIDEIQSAPTVVKAMKYLYDHHRVKFFVTGSSSYYLKNLFPESLAGRKILYELHPLDFEEFLLFRGHAHMFHVNFKDKESKKSFVEYEKTNKLYEEYLEWGGFPQVVLENEASEKKDAVTDIFKSYFEKDVKSLADFKEINAFRDLLLLLLKRTGNKIDITKLASEVGVTRDTIYSYLGFIEHTYFIKLVSPYSTSVDREVSGTRKVYVCDNAILNILSRQDDGMLLENSVFSNLRKHGEVKYYQKRSGGEIDFLLPEQKIALEVKNYGNVADYKKLMRTADSIGMENAYVVSKRFVNGSGFVSAMDL